MNMKNVRNFVYLLFIIFGALVSLSCAVNVQTGESEEEKQEKIERKEKMLEGWGGDRTDRRPPEPMK